MDTVTQVAVDGDGVLVGVQHGAAGSSGPPGGELVTPGQLFSPQEEAFLRHYADRRSRYEAMIAAGYVPGPLTMAEEQGVLAQAGEVLGRTEQLSISQAASAIGADRIAYLAVLWRWCQAE